METSPGQAVVKTIALDRSQTRWAAFDLDALIEADHPARTIWELSGRFELSRFEAETKTREGEAGRPCWPARLLVSIWVYSYTQGVASARAIERMLSHEPGLRWLSADQAINHHTLSDFRVDHKEALEELLAQFLALLDEVGLVDLHTLLQDGTKVKTVAGRGSFHRRTTLEKRKRQARQVMRKLERQAEEESGGEAVDGRRAAGQKRAAQEMLRRAEAALEKLKKLEAKAKPSERDSLRASSSEAEAHKMKQPDGGWAPSYNVQVTTEAQSRMIVAIGVTDAANDTQQLMPALQAVQQNVGAMPERIIADNGYATRDNVEQTSKLQVELIAPWKEEASRSAGARRRHGIAAEFAASAFRPQPDDTLICPAGRTLVMIQQKKHHGLPQQVWEARASDCKRCADRKQCCGNREGPRRVARVVESSAMQRYLKRMKRRAVKKLYRKRCEVAEFPHLWAKATKKWTRFSVRGLAKAAAEALWVALAYNVTQWMRLKSAAPPVH